MSGTFHCSITQLSIIEQWVIRHQALPNKEDGSPLKAVLAHDALVHPDHPLRNGKEGIEMYMGAHLYIPMLK